MKVVSNIFDFIHPDSLIIDMLSITYKPSKFENEYILNAIKEIGWLETWAAKKKNIKGPEEQYKAYIYQNKHYKKVIDLQFPDDNFTKYNVLTIELDPRVQSTSFMRIEYNPSKIPFILISECLKDIMPNGIGCIFEKGRVTRIDFAMDIKQVKPYQIIIDYVKSRFRTSYLESGRPDCIYVGKDNGKNQLYMYDKGKELKKNKIKPLSDYQFPKNGLTRIELRHRPNPTLKFSALYHLKNLFWPMDIVGTPPKIKGDTSFNIKRDLCVLKGIRRVIKQLKYADDKEFADKLAKYSVANFLDLHKLWETLPYALNQVYPFMNMTSTSKF